MFSFLIKHKKSILVITLAFFIGSIIYIGLDSYHRVSSQTNAAMVGSTPITYRALRKASEAQAQLLRKNGLDVDENMNQFIMQQVLSGLINEEILNQSAREYGLVISDYELATEIHSATPFIQNGQFNKVAYEQVLKHQLGMTPAQFEEQIRRSKLADRFRMALYSIYKLTPEEVKFSYKIQHGNLKNFEQNKKDFEKQLFETKMETAQRAFLDDFNNRVEIKSLIKEQA